MKVMLPLLLFVSLTASAQQSEIHKRAQAIAGQNAAPKKTPAVIRASQADTNDFRWVEGKLYNRALSTNWVSLPTECVNSPGTPGQMWRITSLRVAQLLPENHLIVEERYYVGRAHKSSQYFVVKNYPGAAKLVTGNPLPELRVLRTGSRELNGETIAVYDYGTLPPPVR